MSDVESDSSSTRDAFEFILDSSEEESDQHHVVQMLQLLIPIVPLAEQLERQERKPRIGGSVFGRRFKNRDNVGAHNRLVEDYFSDRPLYQSDTFRRRFRMTRTLFNRIREAITAHDHYFVRKRDGIGRLGPSGLVKMTAALRMLSYGCPADSLDEWLKIGESTVLESLRHFCTAVVAVFGEEYLRSPNQQDIRRLLSTGEQRGFPGMLGSLDCMHWVWKNCPTAWHGTHRGHTKEATVILEAVADHELWIWHAFFGMAGSYNDLNVLDNSHLFDNLVTGSAPQCIYTVNGNEYRMGYYLSDGIYPKWATLIQTIAEPRNNIEINFAKEQEIARKDVERAFGVLQSRFAMVARPARHWSRHDLGHIMKTCIILHNMIIENERGKRLPRWRPPRDEQTTHVIEMLPNDHADVANLIARNCAIQSQVANASLKHDLMIHLWNRHGGH